jgi:hypothetical protein
MSLLLLLLTILLGLLDQLLEGVLIALDGLVMLKKDLKLVIILLEEGQSFSILALDMIPELMRHQVLGMVAAIIHLLDLLLSDDHIKLFSLQSILIVINIWIIILEIDSVNINLGGSFLEIGVTCYNGHMVEDWVPNLADHTFRVASIPIGLPLVNVNIIELDLDPDTSSLAALDVDWA